MKVTCYVFCPRKKNMLLISTCLSCPSMRGIQGQLFKTIINIVLLSKTSVCVCVLLFIGIFILQKKIKSLGQKKKNCSNEN